MRFGMLLAPWSIASEMLTETMTTTSSSGELTRNYSKAQLVATILLFRVFYLLAMATSCHFIPEHNPGDGVLRFDMRLNNADNCYCLRGHACDYEIPNGIDDDTSIDCTIPPISGSFVAPNWWKFFLQPLTKWDAARFLTLAVDPSLRNPKQPISPPSVSSSHSFRVSEQAHAFLPLFPWTIQQFALFLYRILPPQLSPPTFESLVVFAGMVFNNFICLPMTILALYSLTISVMSGSQDEKILQEQIDRHHAVAVVVCLVFGVWNPALVFFATNYSESFFAASTILGHLCMQRSKINGSIILWSAGIAWWMIGSYTRSNGTLHCLWLVQDGLARILLLHRKQNNASAIFGSAIGICIQSILGTMLVAFPVRYHDWKGWERHCEVLGVRPLWCSDSDENPSVLGSSFSLYRHIQDKHWNVGFFRYYEWKQIPNFLLAAPILVLGITGAYRWIHWSLITVYGKGKTPSSYKNVLVGWPVHALSESVSVSGTSITATADKTPQSSLSSEGDLLLENPLLLGHYAILAILTFLGLTIAHVQISTRMICSTSPAVIWLIAQSLLQMPSLAYASRNTSKLTENQENVGRFVSIVIRNRSKLIGVYVVLYMFLGVILHVNFLPWT